MGFDLRMRHIDGLSATQAPNRLPLRHLFCLPTPQRHRVGQFPVLMLFAVVSTLEAITATAPMARATNKAVMTTVSVE